MCPEYAIKFNNMFVDIFLCQSTLDIQNFDLDYSGDDSNDPVISPPKETTHTVVEQFTQPAASTTSSENPPLRPKCLSR